MDQLTGMRALCEAVALGSFSAAAERLGISSPMVSKHISALEHRLGARLLHRSSRHLSLTEAGVLYVEQCRHALATLDAAAEAVSETHGAPSGVLKINAPVWCSAPRFVMLMEAYKRQCPEVIVDLHLDNRWVDLTSEGFDAALRATNEPSPTLIARPLCEVSFHLVATPSLARAQASAGPTSTARPLDAVLPNYIGRERLAHVTDALARHRPTWQLRPVMHSNDSALMRNAVHAGIGAALLPRWLIDDDVAAGRLVLLDQPPQLLTVPLYVVYASRQHMPLKLRTFIDFIATELAAEAKG